MIIIISTEDLKALAGTLRDRALALFDTLNADDNKADILRLSSAIDAAADAESLSETVSELRDLLYFVEGL